MEEKARGSHKRFLFIILLVAIWHFFAQTCMRLQSRKGRLYFAWKRVKVKIIIWGWVIPMMYIVIQWKMNINMHYMYLGKW